MFECIVPLIFAFGFSFIIGLFKTVPNKEETVGKIIDTEYTRSSGRRGTYKATIEYFVHGEKNPRTFIPPYRSSSFVKGNDIKLYYNYENPDEVVIKHGIISHLVFIGLCTLSFYIFYHTYFKGVI